MADPKTMDELGRVTSTLLRQHRLEKPRLDRIAAWRSNRVNSIYVPRKATTEYRELVDQARFNILGIVERALTQNLYVDGYRPTGPRGRAPSRDNAPIWAEAWQPNRMDARQAALYRPAVRYGYSYAVVLPGKIGEGDNAPSVPSITPYSPRKLTAVYDDPVNDEWPRFAAVFTRRPYAEIPAGADPLTAPELQDGAAMLVLDDNFIYRLRWTGTDWSMPETDGVEAHDLGVCPVVRFLDAFGEDDLDEECELPPGKVEPLIPTQKQLNQTTYGLLMAQHYTAFKQRWVTGMEIEKDPEGNDIQPFNARVDAIFQAESKDTKFGEFGQTDLKGYLDSRDKGLLYVSTAAQIPPQNILIGPGISNISAEALVALRDGHQHDIEEHQTSFGESVEQMLRLAGRAKGDRDGMAAWEDMSAQVVWRDTTPRSLAQVADALGKLATLLDIPPEALWEMIPGVTDQDIERWKAMREQQADMDELDALIRGAAEEEPELEGEPVAVAGSNGANPTPPT